MSINHTMCGQESTVRQHGLISRRQARDAGMTPRMIEWRVRKGIWVAEHPGVYRSAGAPVTWHTTVMAACLAGGPHAAASHRSAACLLGLDGYGPGPVEVTVPGSSRRRVEGAVLHHTRTLPRADRVVIGVIPCTSAARTLIDLAAVDKSVPVGGGAGLCSARGPAVARVHAPQAVGPGCAGRSGIGVLRELLARRAGTRPAESPKETELARMLVACGLPEPVPQYELRRGGRVLARFDLAWPDSRVAVAFQSYRHHFGRQAWRRDVGRFNEAAGAGWLVFGVTEDDVADGCSSVSPRIAAALCCASP